MVGLPQALQMCSFIPHRAGGHSSVYPLATLGPAGKTWVLVPFLHDKAVLLLAKASTLLWSSGPLISKPLGRGWHWQGVPGCPREAVVAHLQAHSCAQLSSKAVLAQSQPRDSTVTSELGWAGSGQSSPRGRHRRGVWGPCGCWGAAGAAADQRGGG